MKVKFRSDDPDGSRLRPQSIDRMLRALRRLRWLVATVQVRLDDINGPGGGVDKRCHVDVRLRGAAPVAITATARTWLDSIDAVASRLRERVVAQLRHALRAPRPLVLARVRAPLNAGARRR